MVEIEDYMRGALIRLNESFYAKVIRRKVIYYLIKNKRWIKSRPIPIQESDYKFPTDLEGAFQTEDDSMFFFRKFRYCHRMLSDYKPVRLNCVPKLSLFGQICLKFVFLVQ